MRNGSSRTEVDGCKLRGVDAAGDVESLRLHSCYLYILEGWISETGCGVRINSGMISFLAAVAEFKLAASPLLKSHRQGTYCLRSLQAFHC